MRKYIVLAAISLLLITAALAAGLKLVPDSSSADRLGQTASTVVQAAPQSSPAGQQYGQAIWLEMAPTQIEGQTRYTLVPAKVVAEPDSPAHSIICAPGQPAAAPPPTVAASLSSPAPQDGSPWRQVADWLFASIDDQYRVALWYPAASPEEYLLTAHDAQFVAENCHLAPGEGAL